MWELIKYMFKCLAMLISASFGNNPEGMTWTNLFVGIGTLILLIILALALTYLGMIILSIIFKNKPSLVVNEKFSFIVYGEPNKNCIKLHDDRSFGESEASDKWDTQVKIHFNQSSITLNINGENNQCVSVEGYITPTDKNKRNNTSLKIPEAISSGLGVLGIKSDELETVYEMHRKKYYFDPIKNIAAYGNYNTEIPFYEFGIGQYIAINDDEKIEAIIIKFV